MLFDDDQALRNAIALYRPPVTRMQPTMYRQKSSSSDVRSPASRSDSVNLDMHVLYNSPRSFHAALEMTSGSLVDEDFGPGGRNSPKKLGGEGHRLPGRPGEGGEAAGDRGRRSISVFVTSSIELMIERLPQEAIEKMAASKRSSALTDALQTSKAPPTRATSSPPPRGNNGPPPLLSKASIENSVVHRITLYLPDKTPLVLRVPETLTFHEVIRHALYTLKQHPNPVSTLRLGDNPANYELRLHEGNGEADEDLPALDRAGKVKHFGDTLTHEFCLREISSPRLPRTATSTAGGMAGSPPNASSPPSPPPPRLLSPASQAQLLTVFLPNRSHQRVEVRPTTTVNDVIATVLAQHHRLQFSSEHFCLCLSEQHERQAQRANRQQPPRLPLTLPSQPLDGHTLVLELNAEHLLLKRRGFADDPVSLTQPSSQHPHSPTAQANDTHGANVSFQQQPQGRRTQDGVVGGGGTAEERRPDPESFVFTAETAFVYKEWTVTKKNKFGRKQVRLLGMDDVKIYNYKRDSKGNRRTDGVYRAERPISTVRTVEFVQEDVRMLRIHFEEDGTVTLADYVAESAYECAEMVYKLRYVMDAIAKGRRR